MWSPEHSIKSVESENVQLIQLNPLYSAGTFLFSIYGVKFASLQPCPVTVHDKAYVLCNIYLKMSVIFD